MNEAFGSQKIRHAEALVSAFARNDTLPKMVDIAYLTSRRHCYTGGALPILACMQHNCTANDAVRDVGTILLTVFRGILNHSLASQLRRGIANSQDHVGSKPVSSYESQRRAVCEWWRVSCC